LVFSYVGPGWRFPGNGLVAPVDDGSVVAGGIKSTIDLFCNGSFDIFAKPGGGGVPSTDPLTDDTKFPYEDATVRTTTWTALTGPADQPDETFLDRVLPPDSIMDRRYRTRALATSVYLPMGAGQSINPNAPINSIGVVPSWSPNTLLAATFLAGGAASPGTSKLCLDSPQNSISFTSAASGGTGLAGNPLAAGADANANSRDDNTGYYARWAVFVSALDVVNGELQGVLVNNCKYVSANFPALSSQVAPPVGSDDDGDCLEDGATEEPGRSGFVDSNDADADQDDDGIVDGIEVAWGSCPNLTFVFTVGAHGFAFDCSTVVNATDTDADGRSDLEELMATGNNLSNPRNVDTDGDGDNDGGIGWDLDDNGSPDTTLPVGNMQALAGGATAAAKDHAAFQIVGGTIRPFEGDNCTNIVNGSQANSDSERPGGAGTKDQTNPDEDTTGDACETDNDNDGFNDIAELTNLVETTGSGPAAPACRQTAGGAFAAGATTTGDEDSDGDRVLDGAECQEGRNPVDGAEKPAINSPCTTGQLESCESDGDGIGELTEAIERTTGINQISALSLSCGSGQLCDIDLGRAAQDATVAGTTNNGRADFDSDSDGLRDGVEYYVWGTSPANMDTDADGCPDGVEVFSVNDNNCEAGFTDFLGLLNVYGDNSLAVDWLSTTGSMGGVYYDWDGTNDVGFPDFLALLNVYGKKQNLVIAACDGQPGSTICWREP
jgi:hypothetical protein